MEFIDLVEVYEKLEATSKRLEKTKLIADFLKKVKEDDLPTIVLLIQGKLFPNWDEHKIGVASRIVIKAIANATGIETKKIEDEWRKKGDLGVVALHLVKEKKQVTLVSKKITTQLVFDNLRNLALLEGKGTVDKKLQLIAELLTSAKPIEAKYIVRTILEELRVGVGEGTLRDAITWSFFGDKVKIPYGKEEAKLSTEERESYNKYVNAVQRAYDVTNDFGIVAKNAKQHGLKGLEKVELQVHRPIKVMLAIKVKDVEEGLERVGKPAEIEYKYDGFRLQIHKDQQKITLYTRRLENVTTQFPEVVDYVKSYVKGNSFILDAEAVGYNKKTGKYLPFQNISQRIRRKYDIEKIAKELPVEVNVFDLIYYNGKNMIKEDFKKRHDLIKKIIKPTAKKILVAKNIVTDKATEVEKFYHEAVKSGNEGIMLKKLDAPYKPGSRVGYMVKLKPTMETLDLVIVGAEWGEGKRANWLSSFTIACIDEHGKYLEMGKVGTGIKEKSEHGVSFEQLTKELKPLFLKESGREVQVKPKIVVEINYEEIQKSPTYSSGYALRFPRLVTLRLDRSPKDIADLDMVEDFYYSQKKK